jgi:gamma-glutamyltranspeptidase/glutathione hydrolase
MIVLSMEPALFDLRILVLIVFFGVSSALAQPVPDMMPPEVESGFVAKQSLRTGSTMIVAANPLATQAGAAILAEGGSAVDAAIATQLVLNVVEPQSSGIGGGGFLLAYDKSSGEVTAYQGRETAPAGIGDGPFGSADQKRGFMEAVVGGASVGVPGILRMFETAHRERGKLPWTRLFDQAVQIADQGFAVSPRLHAQLTREEALRDNPAARRIFYRPDGSAKGVGDVIRNPDLADTFRQIAANGADAFYTGAIARKIVDAVWDAPGNPGSMSLTDLARYEAKIEPALCVPYRRWRVCTVPPPSSALAVLQSLGILSHFDLSRHAPESVEVIHLVAQAQRLAFADRGAYVADPDFVAVPVAELLDPAYLAARAALIDPLRAIGRATPGQIPRRQGSIPETVPAPELPSTSHLSVVDSEGNAVAFTSSIENAFGSRQIAAGFLLNNQLTDFSPVFERAGRSQVNRPEPGKRPRSSMSPLMVFDSQGSLRYLLGSPGGAAIIGFVLQTTVAMLDWNLEPQEAVTLPRFLDRNFGLELERDTALVELAPRLEAMGHRVSMRSLTSGLHVIKVAPDGLVSGADPRREGNAAGN